jgi:glucose/arabinose dehydrogenase
MTAARRAVFGVVMLAVVALPAPARGEPHALLALGFAVVPFVVLEGSPTSIQFGPDTRDPSRTSLYVADFLGGRVVAVDPAGQFGRPPRTFASGLSGPLGLLVTQNGTVFAADSEGPRDGPFGPRVYGRVWRLVDTDRDGVADRKEVVLKDLPNGRHNTNGLALGRDGMLYVANGNSTDDGVEGGEPEVPPWSGSVIRVNPNATNLSVTRLNVKTAVVARGMRNDFDIAFSPQDASRLFITMNGADDARPASQESPIGVEDSDDLLYATDVSTKAADHFGFPSCLYNAERQGNLEPYDNPNPATIDRFGPCPVRSVPRPLASFGTHTSSDGLAFQRTSAWGAEYRNDLFVAEFGSNPGLAFAGHDVVRVEFNGSGSSVVRQSTFMAGITPLDVTFDREGNLYVADFTGVIFKVWQIV